MYEFQSSPGPWAECNSGRRATTASSPTSFNPHPARGPSATVPDALFSVAFIVFQSSPGPWAECNNSVDVRRELLVSQFQSSPGPWAECNAGCSRTCSPPSLFQSSPGPWAECNMQASPFPPSAPSFNPHPARGPSATAIPWKRSPTLRKFQSSPGPWAECNVIRVAITAKLAVFQSSPGPWAECNKAVASSATSGGPGFNPHPARGPSAT